PVATAVTPSRATPAYNLRTTTPPPDAPAVLGRINHPTPSPTIGIHNRPVTPRQTVSGTFGHSGAAKNVANGAGLLRFRVAVIIVGIKPIPLAYCRCAGDLTMNWCQQRLTVVTDAAKRQPRADPRKRCDTEPGETRT